MIVLYTCMYIYFIIIFLNVKYLLVIDSTGIIKSMYKNTGHNTYNTCQV